jgi:hypothetical protein
MFLKIFNSKKKVNSSYIMWVTLCAFFCYWKKIVVPYYVKKINFISIFAQNTQKYRTEINFMTKSWIFFLLCMYEHGVRWKFLLFQIILHPIYDENKIKYIFIILLQFCSQKKNIKSVLYMQELNFYGYINWAIESERKNYLLNMA